MVHEKNSRVSLSVQEFFQPHDFLWILATIPVLRTCVWLSYSFGFGIFVGLFNKSCDVSEEYGSLRTCLSTLSLDTIAGGWSEWSMSFEGVEVDELEEEFGDKPGTTIGTKFSVLHWIRILFSWDVVLDRWFTHMSIHVHRKAFRAIRLLACFRGLSLSKIYPILWHELRPLHASAPLCWLLWLS